MLSCREMAHRYAGDYLDGQLGWRERIMFRWHLLICKNCPRFIAQMRKVRTLLYKRPDNSVIVAADSAVQELATRLADIYVAQRKVAAQKNSPPPL